MSEHGKDPPAGQPEPALPWPRESLARDLLLRISDAVVALDRDWRYTFVNPQAAALFGREAHALVGKHIWTEFPEGVGQPFHAQYERAFAEQRPVSFEDHYAPWDRWFENRVYPSPDGITIFFHEITDRKRAEQAERDAIELNQHVLASASEGIVVLDTELRIVQANSAFARMIEVPPETLVGSHPTDLLPPDMAQESVRRLKRRSRVRWSMPSTCRHR